MKLRGSILLDPLTEDVEICLLSFLLITIDAVGDDATDGIADGSVVLLSPFRFLDECMDSSNSLVAILGVFKGGGGLNRCVFACFGFSL